MNSIDYKHNLPPSFEARLIQSILGLFGMRKKLEKRMIENSFDKNPARVAKSMARNFKIREMNQDGRKVWTISPLNSPGNLVILYLHGGAYMGNILREHWSLILQLVSRTGATMVVPDYPLSPEAQCRETYHFIEVLYSRLILDYPAKRFIFMGDSAGGGLAFGFVQQLRNGHRKQPDQLIVYSPWLDVTMDNPHLKFLEKEDKILTIKGLKNAGQKYAGDLELIDYRVSPLFGELTGLCRISIFTGTKELLHADARKFKQLMKEQNINFNYFEYPGMFHDWVILTRLKESRSVIDKVCGLLNDSDINQSV